jgi:hypothetical protein
MYCRHLADRARLSLSKSLAELIFADQDLDYVLLISLRMSPTLLNKKEVVIPLVKISFRRERESGSN